MSFNVPLAHTMSETIAQNRVFIYEPHLVAQIAQLVSYDNSVSIVSISGRVYGTCSKCWRNYRIFKLMPYTRWMVLPDTDPKSLRY